MWKDFFYYSKSERRAVLFLLGMGILLLVYGTWQHARVNRYAVQVDSLSVDSFLVTTYQQRASRDSFLSRKSFSKKTLPPVSLSPFDPNTADSAHLGRLGLPSFLVKRILKYRSKGGVFRSATDFARLYGLSEKQYQTLLPYIQIAPAFQVSKKQEDTLRYVGKRVDSVRVKYPEGTVLDLNTLDTLQLVKVPGIGKGLAKMIVSYRNRLGGFASVDQLQEIAYVDTAVNKWFSIETGIFRPLKVNRASLDVLRNHPYMNFYKAKVILEYRRKRGKITGLSQLSLFKEFSEKDLSKLKPYLDFE